MNHKYSNRVKSMKNTRLGKLICRLMGEEQGAVMMEYVIVAVMIAAAVALGAYFFGATILDFFGIAQKSTVGNHVEAGDDVQQMQQEIQQQRIDPAKANANKFSSTDTVSPAN